MKDDKNDSDGFLERRAELITCQKTEKMQADLIAAD